MIAVEQLVQTSSDLGVRAGMLASVGPFLHGELPTLVMLGAPGGGATGVLLSALFFRETESSITEDLQRVAIRGAAIGSLCGAAAGGAAYLMLSLSRL